MVRAPKVNRVSTRRELPRASVRYDTSTTHAAPPTGSSGVLADRLLPDADCLNKRGTKAARFAAILERFPDRSK